MRTRRAGIILTALCLSFPLIAAAQTSGGRIVGVVQDSAGGVLPGVTVVVRNLATSISRETVTNDRGQYEVTGLQPGQYQVEAELVGFRRYSQGPITVQVNQSTRVDPALQVGDVNETITVVAAGIAVQTTTSSLGKVVEEKEILELPLSGRNFASLGLLTPGVTTRGQSTTDVDVRRAWAAAGREQLPARRRGQRVARRQHRAGAAERRRRPGIQDPDEQLLGRIRPQLRVGRAGGHQVGHQHAATAARGSSSETTTSSRRTYFATTDPPPLSQNQYGATLGGPVRTRNRTFFFGAFEGFRLSRGLTRQTVVATAQERVGDFSVLSRAIRRSARPACRFPATGFPPIASAPRPEAPRAHAVAEHRRRRVPAEQLRLVARTESGVRPVHAATRPQVQRSGGTCSIATSCRMARRSTPSRDPGPRAIWASPRRARRARSTPRSDSPPSLSSIDAQRVPGGVRRATRASA